MVKKENWEERNSALLVGSIKTFENEMSEMNARISQKELEVHQMREEYAAFCRRKISECDKMQQELTDGLAAAEMRLRDVELLHVSKESLLEGRIKTLENKIASLQARLTEAKAIIASKQDMIDHQKARIDHRNAQIVKLKNSQSMQSGNGTKIDQTLTFNYIIKEIEKKRVYKDGCQLIDLLKDLLRVATEEEADKIKQVEQKMRDAIMPRGVNNISGSQVFQGNIYYPTFRRVAED